MVTVYEMFTELGRISARFSARLVHAGAINALEDLAALALAREPRGLRWVQWPFWTRLAWSASPPLGAPSRR